VKNLILAISVLTCASPALAMHAYSTDSCVAKTINGRTLAIELGNDEVSPHKINLETSGITDVKTGEIFWVNIDQSKESMDEPAKDSDLVLSVTSDEKTSSRKINDGCFQGEATTSTRIATIARVSKRLESEMDLKKGETLHFSCYTDGQSPSGSSCGK
jgi:hypothetical protein